MFNSAEYLQKLFSNHKWPWSEEEKMNLHVYIELYDFGNLHF